MTHIILPPTDEEIERQAKCFAETIVSMSAVKPEAVQTIASYGSHVLLGERVPDSTMSGFFYHFVRVQPNGYSAFVQRFNRDNMAISRFEDAIAKQVFKMTRGQ